MNLRTILSLVNPRANVKRVRFAWERFKTTATANDIHKIVQFIDFRFQENADYHDMLDTATLSGAALRRLLGHDAITIEVVTDKPVAVDSLDHIHPWGTSQDNSKNLAFNNKLYRWISLEKLRLLDIGCSGGGFVKTVHDAGGFAVGIEGSDFSKVRARAEWATIPHRLFTADASAPYEIITSSTNEKHRQLFSVITSWEMIEHIEEEKLAQTFANIEKHLAPNGVVIMSVSPIDDIVDGVNLHRTVKPYAWWLETVQRFGFTHHPDVVRYFGEKDWIRSMHNATGSFHLALTRLNDRLPALPA